MPRAPVDPRTNRLRIERTWAQIVLGYTLVAAVPLLLWTLSSPLLGGVVVLAHAGLFVAGHRGLGLKRCLDTCGEFAFSIAGRVCVSISRPTDSPQTSCCTCS